MDLSINRLVSGTISLFSSPMSEPTKFVTVALAALALLAASFYVLWSSCWKSDIKKMDRLNEEPTPFETGVSFEDGEEVFNLDGDSFIIGEEGECDSLTSTPTSGKTSEDQIQRLLNSVSKKGNINPVSQTIEINAKGEQFVKLHFATPAARNRALAELRGQKAVDSDADDSTPTKSTILMLTPYPHKGLERTGFIDGRKVPKKLDLG